MFRRKCLVPRYGSACIRFGISRAEKWRFFGSTVRARYRVRFARSGGVIRRRGPVDFFETKAAARIVVGRHTPPPPPKPVCLAKMFTPVRIWPRDLGNEIIRGRG